MINQRAGIIFETGRCHPLHNGLSINGRLPFSISESEFNYMKSFILKNGLKNGYELATGNGISSIAIGYALQKNGGKLVTVDSYLEEENQHQPINDVRCGNSNAGFDRNKMMFSSLGLNSISAYKAFSPNCTEILDQEFNQDIDFVFFDCPKDSSDFIRDLSVLKGRLNKDRFAIFVHDTHCFPEDFQKISMSEFNLPGKFIFDFVDVNNKPIKQTFPLAIITNIKE